MMAYSRKTTRQDFVVIRHSVLLYRTWTLYYTTPIGVRSSAMSVSVCLSVRTHISGTSLHVAIGRGSDLL